MAKRAIGCFAAAGVLLVAQAAQAKTVESTGLMADLALSVGANSHYGSTFSTAPALGWRFEVPLEILVEPRLVLSGLSGRGSAGAALLGKARAYLVPVLSVEIGAGAGLFFGWPGGGEWSPMGEPWIATAGASWTVHKSARTALDVRCAFDFYSEHPADYVSGQVSNSSSRSTFDLLFSLALRVY